MGKWFHRLAVVGALGFFGVGLAACGDDDTTSDGAAVEDTTIEDATADDSAANGGQITPEFADYCEFSLGLDESDSLPSDEQLDEWREIAPEELSDEMDIVVPEFKEKGEAVFSGEGSDEFFTAFESIEQFEIEHCGREDVEAEHDE